MASPLQFAYRTQKAIGVFDADPVYEALPGFTKPAEGNLRCCVYSGCGRYFAYATNEGVVIVDASVGHVLTSLPITTVYDLSFSPHGTYLSTWERPAKDENGDATKNLKIWRTIEELADDAEKQPIGKFVQKSANGWNLQYTEDERFCARIVTNEVQFYQSDDLGTVWNKLRVEGVSDFALAPGKNQNVAVFVPERKVCVLRAKLHLDLYLTLGYRDTPPPSRSSTFPSSPVRFRKRLSSRPTRSSSSGTSSELL